MILFNGKESYQSIINSLKTVVEKLDNLVTEHAGQIHRIEMHMESLKVERDDLSDESDKAFSTSIRLKEMFNL